MDTFTASFKKLFLALSSCLCVLVSCQEEPKDPNSDLKVNCATGDATNVDSQSAVLNGTYVISSSNTISGTACFYFSTESGDATALKNGTKVSAGSVSGEGGSFTASLSSLTPSTVYYFVASVSVSGKEAFGNVKSFKTAEKPKDPSETGEATDITENSAVISSFANPTPEMGYVTMGVVYSTNESPSLDNGKEITSQELDGNNMYTVTARDLSSNTTYYYKSFVKYGGIYRYGAVKSFTTLEIKATIETTGVTDISEFYATLTGKLKVDSKADLNKEVWFLTSKTASTVDELIASGTKNVSSLETDGAFKCALSDLEYGIEYKYIAVAKVHDKVFYSELRSFSTLDIKASVTTYDASQISEFKATVGGNLSIENTSTLSTEVWFLYGKDAATLDELTTVGTKVIASLDNSHNFYAALSDLAYNTKYYYVPVAKIYDKVFYGEVKAFTTLDFTATVTSLDASSVTEFKATMGGSLSVQSTVELPNEVWFLYSKDASNVDDLVSRGAKATSSLDGSNKFYSELSELEYNTEYYYVPVAKVFDKVFYGEVKAFTTYDFSATVATNDASGITELRATINGKVVVDSKETLQKKVWFLYSREFNTITDLKNYGDKLETSILGNDTFSYKLTDLIYNSTYYYVAVAQVHDKVFYGEVNSFTTLDVRATATSVDPTNVSFKVATLNGRLAVETTENLSKSVGFIYGTTEDLNNAGTRQYATLESNNSYSIKLSGLVPNTTYYYRVFAFVHEVEFFGEVKSFTTRAVPDGAVDLGLTAIWATCNLGANNPEDYGNYYSWGDTATKDYYYHTTDKWYNGDPYFNSPSFSKYYYSDNKTTLDPEDDAAHILLRDKWRTPSKADFEELRENCSFTWSSINGVSGCLITSQINGNSIFLPAAGCRIKDVQSGNGPIGWYWSSNIGENINGINYNTAYCIHLENNYTVIECAYRYWGYPIRPVID